MKRPKTLQKSNFCSPKLVALYVKLWATVFDTTKLQKITHKTISNTLKSAHLQWRIVSKSCMNIKAFEIFKNYFQEVIL